MRLGLFSAMGLVAAILQLTIAGPIALVPLVVLLLVLEVDVVPATVVALVAGLFLDLYGIRPFGVSATAMLLLLVGGVEVLHLSLRSIQDRPLVAALALTVLLAGVQSALRAGFGGWHAVLALTGAVLLHVVIVVGAYPVARRMGLWYLASLRAQGLLSG